MPFAAIFCFVLVLFFFLRFQKMTWTPGSSRNLALFHKGMATFSAFLLALYGAAFHPAAGNILLCAGLLICTAADVVLGKNLMRGMAVFGLGHVFYCIGYGVKMPPNFLSLIIFLLLLVLCCFLYPQIKKRSGSKPPLPFLCYGVLLFLMLALAFHQSPVLLTGAFLFVASDLLLAFRIFTQNQSKLLDYICLACYYLAQYLIALSIFF